MCQSINEKGEIRVMLTSVIKHALPVPMVQTIFLEGRNIDNRDKDEKVADVSMCLEHNVDPALCWGQNLCAIGRPANLPSAREIVRHTLPLLNLEAINSAVSNRKQDFVFTNIEVAFFRQMEPRNGYTFMPTPIPKAKPNPFNISLQRNEEELLALVKLPKQMCIDLKLTPQKPGLSSEEMDAMHPQEKSFIVLDLFCIRITDWQIKREGNRQWVGHFVSVDVTKPKYEPFYLALCKCTHASSSIPDHCYSTTYDDNQKLMHPKNGFPQADSQRRPRHNFLRCRVEMIKMEESFRVNQAPHCECSAYLRRYDQIITEKIRRRQERAALEHAAAFELTDEEEMDSEDCWAMKDLIAQLEEHIIGSVADIVITTLGSASNPKRFTFLCSVKLAALVKQLVIDEASTAPELDTLGPILTFINRPTFDGDKFAPRLLLVGDHKQLGPVITSRDASNMGYGQTFFERHIGTSDCSVMLTQHYRMPEAVASWPSETFYNNMLIATARQSRPVHPARFFSTEHAMCFVDVVGTEQVIASATSSNGSFSIRNTRETGLAIHIARRLLATDPTIRPQQICVLAVYRAHIEDVQSKLGRRDLGAAVDALNLQDVQTQTVHSFQGAEWEYIILCCVRSREYDDETVEDARSQMQYSVGLIKDTKCLNVGLTRSSTGLIIIGDYDVISGCDLLRDMLDDYQRRQLIVSEQEYISMLR